MVEPDAGGIEGAGLDQLATYWAKPSAVSSGPLAHGKGIQYRLQGRWCRCPQRGIRHEVDRGRLWCSQAQPFVRDKEERLVFSVVQAWKHHWAAQCAAEIVLPKGGSLHSKVVVEPVVGVEIAVP